MFNNVFNVFIIFDNIFVVIFVVKVFSLFSLKLDFLFGDWTKLLTCSSFLLVPLNGLETYLIGNSQPIFVFSFIENMTWNIFTYKTNDIIFHILIILYDFNFF